MFRAPVFCLIHWSFSLSSFVILSKCLKNFICAASKRCSSLFFSTQTSLPIRQIFKLPNFRKIRPVGAELFQADGRTDRRVWRSCKRRFLQLCAHASKHNGVKWFGLIWLIIGPQALTCAEVHELRCATLIKIANESYVCLSLAHNLHDGRTGNGWNLTSWHRRWASVTFCVCSTRLRFINQQIPPHLQRQQHLSPRPTWHFNIRRWLYNLSMPVSTEIC